MQRVILIIAYIATIPAANWMIGHIGDCSGAPGPCVIPVAPGIYAPSGVLMIGAALVLRDLVQRAFGLWASAICIIFGAALSLVLAPPALALASCVAFFLSELADLLVFTPLVRRRLMVAVAASSLVGAVVDSAVFLWLAFGSLDYLLGQIIGKAWMVAAALPIIALLTTATKNQ